MNPTTNTARRAATDATTDATTTTAAADSTPASTAVAGVRRVGIQTIAASDEHRSDDEDGNPEGHGR